MDRKPRIAARDRVARHFAKLYRCKELKKFSRGSSVKVCFGTLPALPLRVTRTYKRGAKMKIQNILRAQAVMIGFAAMLLLASSAPAQEITNTEWPDGNNVSAPAQAKPAANDLKVAAADNRSAADTDANQEASGGLAA